MSRMSCQPGCQLDRDYPTMDTWCPTQIERNIISKILETINIYIHIFTDQLLNHLTLYYKGLYWRAIRETRSQSVFRVKENMVENWRFAVENMYSIVSIRPHSNRNKNIAKSNLR